MDDLRLVLIIVSALAIAGIFLHGHLSLKKSAKPDENKDAEAEPKRKDPVYDDRGFDQFGVSKPRVKDDVEPAQHVPLVDADSFDIKDKFSQPDGAGQFDANLIDNEMPHEDAVTVQPPPFDVTEEPAIESQTVETTTNAPLQVEAAEPVAKQQPEPAVEEQTEVSQPESGGIIGG